MPSAQPVVLVAVFETSGWLSNTHGTTSWETGFTAKPHADYEFHPSYANKRYGVRIREGIAGEWKELVPHRPDGNACLAMAS